MTSSMYKALIIYKLLKISFSHNWKWSKSLTIFACTDELGGWQTKTSPSGEWLPGCAILFLSLFLSEMNVGNFLAQKYVPTGKNIPLSSLIKTSKNHRAVLLLLSSSSYCVIQVKALRSLGAGSAIREKEICPRWGQHGTMFTSA